MTILVSHKCVLFHFYVFDPSIEKSTSKMPKLSPSASLTSESRGFKSFSTLSRTRSDSFSSCSNESSVYSGSNLPQTRFKNAKSTINQQVNVRKRSRNSSGSSISSNLSGNGDKSLKSSRISPTLGKREVNNCISNDVQDPHLIHSRVNSRNDEHKEEITAEEKLDSSKNSLVLLPKRHNLRGKITRKGCACCPSTHTTVVLRHYEKFIHTEEKTVISSSKSEGKTVISRTSVKTYVENSSPNAASENNTQSNMSSNRSKTRKRRSEIEKLYASLHEIEWAKNFSPDNILRQINVRQAASCSAFGRSSFNADDLPEKCTKKTKISKDSNNSSCTKSLETLESKISSKQSESSNRKNIGDFNILNGNKEMCTVTNCENNDNEQKTNDLQTAEISTSDLYPCKQKPCNPHSSVNVTSCSISHIVKKINVNSTESLATENGTDYSDDAQLSDTSDESSSAISSSIVNLQSKSLLDLKYKNRNRDLSDTDASDYSTPTFFDIAEEGIRTIDACFRGVGAEVVVSTCYDENSLPLLTSVRESKRTIKVSDDPPILEPCVNIEFNCNKKINPIQVNKKSAIKDSFTLPVSNLSKSKQFDLHSSSSRNIIESYCLKKCLKLHYRISRKIVKKYLKHTWFTERLKYLPKRKTKLFVDNKNSKLPDRSDRHFKVNTCPEVKNNDSDISQNSVFSTSSKEGVHLPICDQEPRDKCPPIKVEDEIILDSTAKRIQYLYNNYKKDIYFPSDAGKQSAVFQTDTICKQGQTRSTSPNASTKVGTRNKCKNHMVLEIKNNKSRSVSSLLPAKVKTIRQPKTQTVFQTESGNSQSCSRSVSPTSSAKGENSKIYEDHISRPISSLALSFEYKTIRVNRSYNYTQIILLVTRGKSMFLTLETLRELRDAVFQTNNDSSCQVLVINGVGDSFCLGLDLKPLIGPRKKLATTEIAIAIKELFQALSEFKKPIAAVVNGPALGLGMTLLNHADLTIASEKATFCMPYSYLGYMPEGGATLTLPQVVGSTVATDLILRGRTLTAREACNFGLISEVLEAKCLPHELVSRVRILAQNSLCALETTKALLKMQLHSNLQLILESEVKLLPRMWLTRACQESLRKALETGILSE